MKFKIDLKIIFFLIWFYITHKLYIYILMMFFCFLHECAHLIVGTILKFKLQEIELMPFGFFAKMNANIEDYNKKIGKSNMVELKKILIALAGPIFNFIMIIVISNLQIDLVMKENIVYSNLLILLFNLIPIFPLDGGRVLKSVLKVCYGKRISDRIINIFSNVSMFVLTVISSILILYLKNIVILLCVIYLFNLVHKENQRYELQSRVYELLKI